MTSVSGSHLQNVIIRRAHFGIKADFTALSLRNCVIEKCIKSGIEADLAANETILLHNCSIRSNTPWGMLFRGNGGTSKVEISNCTVSSNSDIGIYVVGGGIHLSIVNCRLEKHRMNLRAYPSYGAIEIHGSYFGPHVNSHNYWTADIRMGNNNDYKASMIRYNKTLLIYII